MSESADKSKPEEERPTCGICGEPMPEGEDMFKYHGYSGNSPDLKMQDVNGL